MPEPLAIVAIVFVGLWGTVTLLVGIWVLVAEVRAERRERAVTFPVEWCERRVYDWDAA